MQAEPALEEAMHVEAAALIAHSTPDRVLSGARLHILHKIALCANSTYYI